MADESKGLKGLELMLLKLTGLTVEPAGITRAKADDLERHCYATRQEAVAIVNRKLQLCTDAEAELIAIQAAIADARKELEAVKARIASAKLKLKTIEDQALTWCPINSEDTTS